MKKVLLVLVTALALVGIMVVPALAGKGGNGRGAAKLPLRNSPGEPAGWTWCDGATNITNPTVGFVILNTNASGDLIVQVSLKGVPKGTYTIYVNQLDAACSDLSPGSQGTLSTNIRGNGNAHVQVPRHPSATRFWVSAMGDSPLQWSLASFRSTAVELD